MVLQHGKWQETNYTWANNPFKWSDIAFVEELVAEAEGAGGSVYEAIRQQSEKYSPKKKKKFIKLVCIINNIEYSDKKFADGDIKVTVDDIKVLVEAVNSVKLKVNIK